MLGEEGSMSSSGDSPPTYTAQYRSLKRAVMSPSLPGGIPFSFMDAVTMSGVWYHCGIAMATAAYDKVNLQDAYNLVCGTQNKNASFIC